MLQENLSVLEVFESLWFELLQLVSGHKTNEMVFENDKIYVRWAKSV